MTDDQKNEDIYAPDLGELKMRQFFLYDYEYRLLNIQYQKLKRMRNKYYSNEQNKEEN